MHVCVRVSDPLKLELLTVVSCHVGTEPGSSGRAASALTCCAISPVPRTSREENVCFCSQNTQISPYAESSHGFQRLPGRT